MAELSIVGDDVVDRTELSIARTLFSTIFVLSCRSNDRFV